MYGRGERGLAEFTALPTGAFLVVRPVIASGLNPPLMEACAAATAQDAMPNVSQPLRIAARNAWDVADPAEKALAAQALTPWLSGSSECEPICCCARVGAALQLDDALRPGRPLRPLLVHPRDVPARGIGTPAGRAALLHAIAHIEFNAIDLALDAVWRFPDMPHAWYLEWASVAVDEARHFTALHDELARRGYAYGDFDAHDGLWEMAMKTRHDPLVRVALVPRLMEARGLDVTPGIMKRLGGAGDRAAVDILAMILREEVRHVQIGNTWYERLCTDRGLDPIAHWDGLARAQGAARPQAPFNIEARLQAGFRLEELIRWGHT